MIDYIGIWLETFLNGPIVQCSSSLIKKYVWKRSSRWQYCLKINEENEQMYENEKNEVCVWKFPWLSVIVKARKTVKDLAKVLA